MYLCSRDLIGDEDNRQEPVETYDIKRERCKKQTKEKCGTERVAETVRKGSVSPYDSNNDDDDDNDCSYIYRRMVICHCCTQALPVRGCCILSPTHRNRGCAEKR